MAAGSAPWAFRLTRTNGKHVLNIALGKHGGLATALLAVALLVGFVGSAAAEKPPQLSQATIEQLKQDGDRLADQGDYQGALEKYTQAYLGVVSRIRGQEFLRAVTPSTFNREQLGKEMLELLKTEYTPEELLLMDSSYKVFGLVPLHLDTSKLMTDLLTEEVAGFYDPDNKRMVLIVEDNGQPNPSWLGRLLGAKPAFDKDEQKTTLAHELTHALQDQLYDLNAMEAVIEKDDDMLLAFSALVEGDATLLMFAEAGDEDIANMDPDAMRATFNMLSWMMPLAGGKSYRTAPPIFRDSLTFPYFQGMLFVLSLAGEGGWQAIHEAYQNPPLSTEQILHPDKYLVDVDNPQAVILPELQQALGEDWQCLGGNCLGELQTSILLKKIPGGKSAAIGWDGDYYQVYRHSDSNFGLVYASVWDTTQDAQEFAEAFRAYRPSPSAATDSDPPPAENNDVGTEITGDAATAEKAAGTNDAGAVDPAESDASAVANPQPTILFSAEAIQAIEQRDDQVWIVEGFNATETAAILAMLPQIRLEEKSYSLPQPQDNQAQTDTAANSATTTATTLANSGVKSSADVKSPADVKGVERTLDIHERPATLAGQQMYRGPVDVLVGEREDWAVSVNELSSTLSLIDLQTLAVVDEIACGQHPTAIALLPEDQLLVSCRDAGQIQRFAVEGKQLTRIATIETGYQPMSLAVDAAHQRAYAGLLATGEIAEIDLQTNRVVYRIPVGRWPRSCAVTPDGSRLAVGLSGDSQIAIVDTDAREVLYEEPISGGINIGHMQASADGTHVYFPWMIYRTNPIDVGNIRRGWVLASRIGRVRFDGPAYREAISLDVPRLAVADPHGLAITPDEQRMAVTSSGTHEVLVYRIPKMPFVGAGGPGDLIDEKLLRDNDAFYRIAVGGRPMGIRPSNDNRRLFIANHVLDTVQIVDLDSRQLTQSIRVGDLPDDAHARLVHRGMEIFHDAGRSLDQWYSCRSCHLDGGSNAKAMDTWNDGSELTAKTVLPLFGVTETGPWTWHGWQDDLDDSIQNSFESTMQGKPAEQGDIAAVRAYLASLQPPRNPFRGAETAAARRGQELFHSPEVGCADCHSGARFTDGEVHDVGLGGSSDKYDGFNTPSLVGVYQKVRLLHDGRSKTLEDVLSKWHTPQDIGGGAELSPEQRADLIEYLKTL